jgi:uncharacterized membrane protein
MTRPRARLALVCILVSLAFVSHPPRCLRSLFGAMARQTGVQAPPASALQQPVFAGIIEPILRQHCVACHGAEKQKADLRLDTFEALLRGGQNGPVIQAGRATDSPLIQRLLVPLEADGRMPPEDQPQPTAEEIAVLQWWVNAGAPANEKIQELKSKPELRRLVEVVSKPTAPAR